MINSQDMIDYITNLTHPSIVKSTISYMSNSIASKLPKPILATCYGFSSRRGNYEIMEGSSFMVVMCQDNPDNLEETQNRLEKFLEDAKKQYELVLFINKRTCKFGLAAVEYFSSENW